MRPSGAPATAGSVPLLTAFVFGGLSMRVTVTSIGPVLDDLQDDLAMSDTVAGVVTALPLVVFAAVGALTPALGRRFGIHRTLVAAALLAGAATLLRSWSTSAGMFAALTALTLFGGAVCNVALPALAKAYSSTSAAASTRTLVATYTTALALGTSAAAALTVPIGSLSSGQRWRLGLAVWCVTEFATAFAWWRVAGPPRSGAAEQPTAVRRPGGRRLVHSRSAWWITGFFALRAMQAYIVVGWAAKLLKDGGVSAGTAGWMIALMTAIAIPVAAVVPRIPPTGYRPAIVMMSLCSAAAYFGLWWRPTHLAWIWMTLAGVGGGTFPLALVLITAHTRRAEVTASLSGFVHATGYALAGVGPFLFGLLHDATDGWWAPLLLLLCALLLDAACGWRAAGSSNVEDELTPAPSMP